MIAYVFKPARRKGGKVYKSRLYSARYKLPGQPKTATIALHVTDRQVAEINFMGFCENWSVSRLVLQCLGVCVWPANATSRNISKRTVPI
jgi:hypothetical protein